MISLEDVIAFCDLTPDEVRAIAEHEHVVDGIAAVLGRCLLQSTQGAEQIKDMLMDYIRTAVRRHEFRMPGSSFRRCVTSCTSIPKPSSARRPDLLCGADAFGVRASVRRSRPARRPRSGTLTGAGKSALDWAAFSGCRADHLPVGVVRR